MNTISVCKKVNTLTNLIDEIPRLEAISYDNKEYHSWSTRLLSSLEAFYGKDSTEYTKIDGYINPKFSVIGIYYEGMVREKPDYQRNYLNRLQRINDELQAYVSVLKLYEEELVKQEDNLRILLRILGRFHLFVQDFNRRTKIKLDIKKEQDVQNVLMSILRLHYADVRQEEGTPSCCGQNSRMDFLLLDEQIAIEVKMTRESMSDKELCNQLIEDIYRYPTHPNCKTLVCFIYDPVFILENPVGIAKDLEGKSLEIDVKVVISPHN